MNAPATPYPELRRSLWATFLIGVGVTAAVDEIVFHQILAWHHFYDHATPAVALMSDGFLHAAELIAIVAGFYLVADLRRRRVLALPWAWAGFFLGGGLFQIFDGVVNHKILRLHQIRYGVDSIIPYDVAWNGVGVIMVAIGVAFYLRARRTLYPISSTQRRRL
jgi:uncharacterized membrane protein